MDRNSSSVDPPPIRPEAVASASPSIRIPDHELLRCIGRGSYGEVWLARNQMGAFRAVKVVYRTSFQNHRPFERELAGIRKFEPLSRSHEGFVDILHVGINEEQGYFYYIMELGDDQQAGCCIQPESYSPKTLAKQLAAQGRLQTRACLELGLALSQALTELHKHGLVHRDIKPSNIIFVNGVPKLADIGLVAQIDEARSYVGTSGFIPPEGPGRAPADVYALGKVLYEAGTGKDRNEFPALPSEVESFPDREEFIELNEIILHACHNEVAYRYHTAWDMHAELVALANGKSIRRLRVLERRMSRLKRAGLVLAGAVAVLAALLYPVYEQWRNAIESRQRKIGTDVAYGNRTMEAGDLLGALPYYSDALLLDRGNGLQERSDRLRFGAVLAQCPKLTGLWSLGTRINDGQFSPDGKHVLVTRVGDIAEIYDVATRQRYLHPFGKGSLLCSASYSPDGHLILTVDQLGSVCVWNAATLEQIVCMTHTNRVLDARFSPDASRIVMSCEDGQAIVRNALTGRGELVLSKHTNAVFYACFSHNGRLIATASTDYTSQIWDAVTGQRVGPPLQHPSWVQCVAFSPDDQKVVTACLDHKARVWEAGTGRRVLPDLEHRDGVRSVEYSPDGRMIVSGSFDGTVRLWDSQTLQPMGLNSVLRHGQRVLHAGFDRDGRRILSTCIDGSVRIWDLAGSIAPSVVHLDGLFCLDGSRFVTVTNDHVVVGARDRSSGPLIAMTLPGLKEAVLNRDGAFLATLNNGAESAQGTNERLRVFEVSTAQPAGPDIILTNAFTAAILSDDGKFVTTVGGQFAQLWDVGSGKPISPLWTENQRIRSVFFDRTGSRMVLLCGNQAHVWDIQNGRPAFTPLEHSRTTEFGEFSTDGSLLVTCCSDQTLNECAAQLWDTRTGQRHGPPLAHRDGVLWAAFAPDNRRVVTASEDFTAIEWDVASGKPMVPALEHEDQVRCATFSPDGKWIATACGDKTAQVWSADSGNPLTPPLRHLAELFDVQFTADSRALITSDRNRNSWIWKLPMDHRSFEDLMLIAYVLSCGSASPSSGWTPTRTTTVQTLWEELRAKFPSDFTVSPDEVAAWHEREARTSELQSQWYAARFHLERLVALRPHDSSLQERLRRAGEQFPADN